MNGFQLKNTPFDQDETEFGENYSHKMAILNRTGRKI